MTKSAQNPTATLLFVRNPERFIATLRAQLALSQAQSFNLDLNYLEVEGIPGEQSPFGVFKIVSRGEWFIPESVPRQLRRLYERKPELLTGMAATYRAEGEGAFAIEVNRDGDAVGRFELPQGADLEKISAEFEEIKLPPLW